MRDLDDVAVGLEHGSGQATRTVRDAEAVEFRALVGTADRRAEVVRHRASAQYAGYFARVVPARPISHEVESEVVAHQHRVFIVRPALADVCRAARLEHELSGHWAFSQSLSGSRCFSKARLPESP